MSAGDDALLRRLRWRSRRGMRELDQLMERFLDRRWPAAGEHERATFQRLLECEDDRLWKWFVGRERPDDPELAALVDAIVELPR